MGIPLDKASLLALFLETLFYGAFPIGGRRHGAEFHVLKQACSLPCAV
jgi:hypothetical protein